LLVISDRAASGERPDQCANALRKAIRDSDYTVESVRISSDDRADVTRHLLEMLTEKYDLLLTSGGTGCSPRDITPEVTRRILEKHTPGIDEAIRRFSLDKSPNAIFSRAVSGIAGSTLVINLPGSPSAVQEIMKFLLPSLHHPLDLLRGTVTDCAEDRSSQ
jgi:molybdenum cofactor synthesis domain-containing protein